MTYFEYRVGLKLALPKPKKSLVEYKDFLYESAEKYPCREYRYSCRRAEYIRWPGRFFAYSLLPAPQILPAVT